jgi:hypothetical protein
VSVAVIHTKKLNVDTPLGWMNNEINRSVALVT